MTYLDEDAERIRRHLPDSVDIPENSDRLFLLYAVVLRAKGTAATASDVHDAWTAWQQDIQPDHEALRPYQDLPADVQAEDQPFLTAIHAAAEEQPK